MRVPCDTICKVCQGVFCCAECRHKHEIKNHAILVRKPIMIPTENIKNNIGDNTHGGAASFDTTYLLCPICENQPLLFKSEIHDEILVHIELHHLPLRCQKCFKIYSKINDLKEFSKCMFQNRDLLSSNQSCYTDETSKITVTKANMPNCIIPQSSPLTRQDLIESHITPISLINMRWKAKSKLTNEEFISDSVSSIKNLSSISNSSIRQNIEKSTTVKGKVIRCSSTPVQLEMAFAKPKEQTFNATGPHMSSIQYNSGCESDISPALSLPNSQALEPANRYMKLAGPRPRMSAVTPLRQVMSKSIQKAFAKHGLPASNSVKSINTFQRKNMFDSTSSPDVNGEQSSVHPALDLRLSPAVRRCQNECNEFLKNGVFNRHNECNEANMRREIVLSSQKLTTESIVITRTERLSSVSSSTSSVSTNYGINSVNSCPITNNSYQSAGSNNANSTMFKSCSSVKIITATTEEIQQLESFDGEKLGNSLVLPLTPITRIPGSLIHKKNIKFETPKVNLYDTCETENSQNDLFFTPNATPMHDNNERISADTKHKILTKQNLNGRFSTHGKPSIKQRANATPFSCMEVVENDLDNLNEIGDEDDEVFLAQEPEVKSKKLKQSNGLWSLMTSVMRLPSFKGINSKESYKIDEAYSSADSNSSSLIKRCASIAGSLVRSKSLVDEKELSSLKRKRTYTTDNQSALSYLAELNNSKSKSPTSDFNTSSKRFRIQGRRPIDRMRLNNS